MKNTKLCKLVGALVAALLVVPRLFAAGELGDPAAPLRITDWVKGKPVDLAAGKGKQVYVIEFWATWCGPCRQSIPHLTEMQKKFKDVIFVGVSDEKVPVVKRFVDQMGDKMDYTVAVDDDRKTSAGYMEAFGIGGIPHAFIVDKEGRIVWNGHPMDHLEEALTEVLAGKFNLEKAKKRASAQAKMEAFFEAAAQGDDAKADALGKELVALDTEVGGITPGEKFDPTELKKRAQFQGTMQQYQMAMSTGEGAEKLAELEKKLEASAPKEFKLAEFKEAMTLNKVFSAYFRAAAGKDEKGELPDLAKKVAGLKTTNPDLLNEWAWALLTDERLKTHDATLAATLAKQAVDLTESKKASILDTYARALADSGKAADAVAWQKKALAAADDDEMKKEMSETLKKYEAKAAK